MPGVTRSLTIKSYRPLPPAPALGLVERSPASNSYTGFSSQVNSPIFLVSWARNLGFTFYFALCFNSHQNPIRSASEISPASAFPSAHCPSQDHCHLSRGFWKNCPKSPLSLCVLLTGSLSPHVKPPLAPLSLERVCTPSLRDLQSL